MLRQAKVYTTRRSEAEDAEVWQELANNREAVTEGSQGQPRSGSAPGSWTIQFSPERATDVHVLTSNDPRSAALSGLNIFGFRSRGRAASRLPLATFDRTFGAFILNAANPRYVATSAKLSIRTNTIARFG